MSPYYNPPAKIRDIGRKLNARPFESLISQLRTEHGEVLFGLYLNRNLALVAAHIDSAERQEEIFQQCLKEPDGSYAPIDFYAVDRDQANLGCEPPIP